MRVLALSFLTFKEVAETKSKSDRFFPQTPPCTGAGAFDSPPPVEVSIRKSASNTFGLRTL